MRPTLMVNGRTRRLGDVESHVTLLDWLRADGLTGSKEGCAEGECGACAVLISRPDTDQGSRWTAINACLVPAAGFDGQEVFTAEGLGSPEALHPVQQEMAVRGGSQCGYCTPGFICSMAGEFYRPDRRPPASGRPAQVATAEPVPDETTAAHRINGQTAPDPTAPGQAPDHEHGPNGFDLHALSGNLCRCTGYRPIRDAAYALGQPDDADPLAARATQPAPAAVPTRLPDFVRPATLAEALDLMAEHPEAQVVAGSTDWGVELNLFGRRATLTIAVDRLEELRELSIGDTRIEIGGALTLSEIERGLAGSVPLLAEFFPQFASRLIRNGATLGGNLGTASPIGDAPPALLALDAAVVLASAGGDRVVPLADYWTGYRRTVRRPDELIRTIQIPTPVAQLSAFHKIAKRRFDDISSIAVAFALRVDTTTTTGTTVTEARVGVGGAAAVPLRARACEEALTGRRWTAETVAVAADALGAEGTPLSDHRASAGYRAAMLRQSLLKFHAENPLRDEEVAR